MQLNSIFKFFLLFYTIFQLNSPFWTHIYVNILVTKCWTFVCKLVLELTIHKCLSFWETIQNEIFLMFFPIYSFPPKVQRKFCGPGLQT